MQAINRQFAKIINGTTQFVIPVFQRDYSWTESHCQQLWDDLVRVGQSSSDRGHFMGSLVYIPSGDSAAGFTRWLLIDGQQRMTTLTLLLLALRKHLQETGWKGEGDDAPTARRLDAYFLKNVQEDGDRQYKLVLRRKDQDTLRSLLEDAELPADASSRLQENFEFFRERMAEADPTIVYQGIGRLVVVDVTLDRVNDDPQMIFESLNSTGLDLSQADLIRNFILMRVPEQEQTRLYEAYWRKIEEVFRGASGAFDAFARDYMALLTRAAKQVRADDVYHAFRRFFLERQEAVGIEEALKDLLRFARYQGAFVLGRTPPAKLAVHLSRLNRLAEVAAILVMKLFDLHDRAKTLSEPDFVECLALLESYVFRRAVCGLQTRGYWQVFASIAYRLRESDPLGSLKVLLHQMRESYRFVGDEQFARDLTQRDVYGMRVTHFLLDRLENHDTREPTDTSSYTVEHILPQNENLSAAWREMLGAEWQTIQKTWLHRLGNLTLTGYNSTYSDRPFEEKKTIKGGFRESSVRLNRSVAEQARWTAVEIESRGQKLATLALKVWRPLTVGEAALQAAKQDDLRVRAAKRDPGSVEMTAEARTLFDTLRPRILALHADVIEVTEANSIVYHAADGDFFLEVLPRKHRLLLLLNLELSECEYRDANLDDTTDWKFVVNAKQEGSVAYQLKDVDALDGAMRVVRQAHDLAAQ